MPKSKGKKGFKTGNFKADYLEVEGHHFTRDGRTILRDEIPGLGHFVGAIIQTTSDGFTYSEFFTSQKKLDAKWKKVEKETSSYGED